MTCGARDRSRPLARIAWQTALAAGLIALVLIASDGFRPDVLGMLYVACVSGELCRVDIREHRLPNSIVLPGFAITGLGLCWQLLTTGEIPIVACVAGSAYFGFLLLLNLAGGMGAGDVKLGGLLGTALGPLGLMAAYTSPAVAFLAGGIVAALAVVTHIPGALGRIPFGPPMLFGFWAAVGLAA
jgi:leader peptidase (prepilin peptidase) / N-methyltransferase